MSSIVDVSATVKPMRNYLQCILIFLASLPLLNGCSPAQFVNAFISSELRVRQDIAYGPLERQMLDVYTSPATHDGRDVVIFVHGGYWDSGDKADYAFVADSLTEHGFTTVIPNYRLVPEVTFPSYVEDVALAVKWVFDNLQPRRVFLMGHSAGAHIAALVAFDEGYLEAVGVSNTRLTGLIGLAGPYDFLPLSPGDQRTRRALGPQDNWAATQPIHFVDSSDPPAFLATGLADATVDPANSERLATRIYERGKGVELKTYPGLDHATLLGALARAGRVLEPRLLDDVVAFMRRRWPEA
jgi:acetyl esterase/lipase